MPHVRLERPGPVWTLVFDRPPANAVDLELATAFADAVSAIDAAADCLGLVVTGAGRCFSAGIDVKAVPRYDAATRATMLRTVNATMARFYGLRKPVVAAVNGHALGAAHVLALACDVRLAADGDYRVGLTEAAAGIPFPAVPLLVVEAEVSERAGRLATATGSSLAPGAAVQIGLLDEVLPAATLLDAARRRAEALATLPAFVAVKAQLRRATLARMQRIVAEDDEPLLRGWIA